MVRRRLQTSQVRSSGARRLARAKVEPRRPAIPPARLAALDTRPVRIRRARRLAAVRISDPSSRLRTRETGHRLSLGIELLRAVVLVAGAIVAVLVLLPELLESA